MAALWRLPALYICENNRYGMGTSVDRASASTDFYKRGSDYVPGIRVNGMDVLAVKEAIRWARKRILSEESAGPLVMEMLTYRYQGHSMSDPGRKQVFLGTTYRTRDEIQEIRSTQDPIRLLQGQLLESGWCSEAEIKTLEKRVRAEVEAEVQKAMQDEKAAGEEALWQHIYSDTNKS